MKILFFLLPLCLFACSSTPSVHTEHEAHLCGAYTEYRALSIEDDSIFHLAAPDSLMPLKVATQVVAGTNYSFLCQPISASSRQLLYEVIIFLPLPNQGAASLSSVSLREN